jgi:hypothetical protein
MGFQQESVRRQWVLSMRAQLSAPFLLRHVWLCHPSQQDGEQSFSTAGAIGFFMDRLVGDFISKHDGFAIGHPIEGIQTASSSSSFMEIISLRQVQMLVFAKFMSDAAWFFLLFWLPKYLYDARGFDVKQVSYFAWIPYAASGVGSFLGGWISSQLLEADDRWTLPASGYWESIH